MIARLSLISGKAGSCGEASLHKAGRGDVVTGRGLALARGGYRMGSRGHVMIVRLRGRERNVSGAERLHKARGGGGISRAGTPRTFSSLVRLTLCLSRRQLWAPMSAAPP